VLSLISRQVVWSISTIIKIHRQLVYNQNPYGNAVGCWLLAFGCYRCCVFVVGIQYPASASINHNEKFSRTEWSGLPDLAAPTHKFVWSFLAGFYGRIEHFHTVIKISNMFVKLLVPGYTVAGRPFSVFFLPFSIVGGSWTYKLTFWLPTGAANDQRHTVPSSLRWSSSSSSSSRGAATVRTSFHVYDPSTRAIKLYTNKRSKDQKPRYLHTKNLCLNSHFPCHLSLGFFLKFIQNLVVVASPLGCNWRTRYCSFAPLAYSFLNTLT